MKKGTAPAEKSDTKASLREIERRVAEIIISELKLEDVAPDTFDPRMDLVDELGIDSMDLTTVVLVLQDEYNIAIDADDYPKLRNLQQIADYIQAKKVP